MASRKQIEEQTETLLIPIAEENGVSIYDVEYVKEGPDWYLRAYIDKDGGVNINDCETVSRALSDALDREDFIQDAYILEVSSPGLGRKLTKDRHLQNSLGAEVECGFFAPQDGEKEVTGILSAYDKDRVTLMIDGQERSYERAKISVLRLALDF